METLKLTYNLAPILFWIIPIALIVGGICLKIALKYESGTTKEEKGNDSPPDACLGGIVLSCFAFFIASIALIVTWGYADDTMRVVSLDGAKVIDASITNGFLRVQIGTDAGVKAMNILGEIVELEVNPEVITVGERTINALGKMDFKLGGRSIAELTRDAVLVAENQK